MEGEKNVDNMTKSMKHIMHVKQLKTPMRRLSSTVTK